MASQVAESLATLTRVSKALERVGAEIIHAGISCYDLPEGSMFELKIQVRQPSADVVQALERINHASPDASFQTKPNPRTLKKWIRHSDVEVAWYENIAFSKDENKKSGAM